MNCFYCNCEIFEKHSHSAPGIINKLIPPPRNAKNKYPLMTKDHKVPRCMTKGQHNHEIVLSCEQCNSEKNNLTLEEFRVVKAFRFGYIQGVEFKFPGEDNEQDIQRTTT